LDVKSKPEKDSILQRIREFHELTHPHIARIISSYARGQTVAFLTVRCETNLADFLDLFAGPSEADLLLAWMSDLSSALSYLHTLGIPHRALRPTKILVNPDTRQIALAPFGIAPPARGAQDVFVPFSTDPAYIYAAPEVLAAAPRPVKDAFPADVWGLGCVFLEMATAARGTTLDKLAHHLSALSDDASYAVNRNRALAWASLMREQTAPSRGTGSTSTRRGKTQAQVGHVLLAVLGMLASGAGERPDMRRVVAFLESGRDVVGRKVREDIRGRLEGVGRDEGVWGDLESLNGYYSR
jgi:serine/threonine protein kinase